MSPWNKDTNPPPKSPGRPPGKRDRVPRTWKGTLRQVFQDLAEEEPGLIYRKIEQGLRLPAGKALPFLQMMQVALDKDTQTVPVEQVRDFLRALIVILAEEIKDADQLRRITEAIRRLTGFREPIDVIAGTAPTEPEAHDQ